VCLLARDADIDGLYHNLRKAWKSLDSITGERFLFVFAGKENDTQEERWNSKIIDVHERWVGAYSDYVSFLNSDTELTDYVSYDWRRDKDKNMERIAENQTDAINSLRDYFSISENDIPCLVFIPLLKGKRHIVPVLGNDVYRFFKLLFNEIYPMLKKLEELSQEMQRLSRRKAVISKEIEEIKLNPVGTIIATRRKLLSFAETMEDNKSQALIACINNRSYGKFDQPVRGMLSKYVDLIANYEKNSENPFDPDQADAKEAKTANEKAMLESELSEVSISLEQLIPRHQQVITEIETIIGVSRMSEKKTSADKLSISVTGGAAQINIAFDEGKIDATQHNEGMTTAFNFSNCNIELRSSLHELADELGPSAKKLRKAISLLERVSRCKSPEEVKKKGVLPKLKHYMEILNDENSSLRKVVSGVTMGLHWLAKFYPHGIRLRNGAAFRLYQAHN